MLRVAAIVGPTAVGKSACALEVAEILDAEIVSVDSMQSYRAMDAGTDKPTPAMRARVPHHMIDVWPASHETTVAEFQSSARAAIESIAGAGRLPLLVGGSGLYFRAVVDDLTFPPRSPAVRASLESEAGERGVEALYARLLELDPLAARHIEPGNERRIVRALEVIEITGRPFSENDAWHRYESRYDLAVAGLMRPRAELFERIEARVDAMLEGGLVEEARALARAGMSRAAGQALGYRQILECPEGDPAPDLRTAIARATRRFARRQESWFRADPRVEWFEAARPDLAQAVAALFRASLRLA